MTEEVSSLISTAVETSLSALLIIMIVSIINTGQKYNANINEQQVVVNDLNEYRKHNQFDGTVVYQQDIISAIYMNRGLPTVCVRSSKGEFIWSEVSTPCEYNTNAIASRIDDTVTYDASLQKGANGEVIGYVFVPHVVGGGA